MPLETEIKLKVDSHEPIRERLRELGAEHLGTVMETNSLYDRPDNSLMKAGCGLRIRSRRSSDGKALHSTITFKGPLQPGPYKTREEIEIETNDERQAGELLAALGFECRLSFEKRRESWTLQGCRIELDEPAFLGSFVEIEAKMTDPEGIARDSIAQVQFQLGLKQLPHIPQSYAALILNHCSIHGIKKRFFEC